MSRADVVGQGGVLAERVSVRLPLAAAQARLGRPGRPRTRPITPDSRPDGDKQGDNARRAMPKSSPPRGLVEQRTPAGEAGVQPGGLLPRLLTVSLAAAYLSLGEDAVVELLAAGILARVTVPAPVTAKRRGGAIRKVLLDRYQLDAAVTEWTRASIAVRVAQDLRR